MDPAIAPSDLGLGYTAWRPGQLQAVLAVAQAFGSGKQVVMLEGPPGTGKSGVAIAVARLLGYQTCFLTSTKDLQEQYRELSQAPKVLGRPNFACRIKPVVSAAVGQCVSQIPCDYAGTGGNARAGCCLVPETKVLTADLRWVPVGSLEVGQELIGFDEDVPHGPKSSHRRKFRRSIVEQIGHDRLPVYQVMTSRGIVRASAEHKWLVQGKSGSPLRWIKTSDLRPGDAIRYAFQPWEERTDYLAGYVAGFLDGEGSVWKKALTYAQNPGPTLEKVRGLLLEDGYKPVSTLIENTEHKCEHDHITSRGEILRLLGSVRPPRLLAKADCVCEGSSTATHEAPAVVLECEYEGNYDVVTLQTSTRTLIANGMLTHNSYYDQLRVGLASPEAILNYAFGLGGANFAGHFTGRDLWVCDEAHLLRKELEGFIQIKLDYATLRRLRISPVQSGTGVERMAGYPFEVEGWVYWAKRILPELKTMKSELGNRIEDDGLKSDPESIRVVADPRTLATLTRMIRDLELLTDGRQWVLKKSDDSVEFRPVWVAPYAQRFLWRHAKKFLLMSATIGDAGLMCEVLGLDPKQVQVIRCPSTFDRNRRPVHYRPVIKVSGGAKVAESAEALTPEIDRILDQHGMQKGLIHTVSYPLAWEILKRSRHQNRLIIPKPNTREEVLKKFRESMRPDVLISPSLTTGVDLPYDLVRFQILAKLPFTDRTDAVAVEQQKVPLGKKLGMHDAAQTLAQAYGRGMRAEDDYCTTYLLDGQFQWFKYAAKNSLPRWLMEAVVYD